MQLVLGDARIDLARLRVERGTAREHLTSLEAAVLRYLAQAEGRTVSRDELFTAVWGHSGASTSRATDSVVVRLRRKIEPDPTEPAFLLTVHGEGYRLVREGTGAAAAPPIAVERRYRLGDAVLDLDRLRIERPSGPIALTGREAAVLEVLVEAGGASVDRDRLQRRVWGSSAGRPLDNTLVRLRRKLEPDPERPRLLLRTADGVRLELGPPDAAAPGADGGAGRELIGRDGLLARLSLEVRPGRRVALVGPPGVGKTAITRAWQPPNAVLVEVGGVEGPLDLAMAVARAMDLTLGPHDPVPRLGRALAGRRSEVLILDEVERAVPACRSLAAELIAAAPGLGVLFTSRVADGLELDAEIEVLPLARDEAFELYLRRARAASPAFRSSPEALAGVEALVERLDGLPLAIELAAARADLVPPHLQVEALARRGLDLLGDPTRGGRHATLRAALDDSWEPLDPDDREALLVLSLFRRFTVEDAEALLGPEALARVAALRARSLVAVRDGDGGLGMLEVVREYLDEQRALLPDGGRAGLERQIAHLARRGDPEHLDHLVQQPDAGVRAQAAAATDLALAARRADALGLPALAARCAHGAAWTWNRLATPLAAIELVESLGTLDGVPADLRARLEAEYGGALADVGRFDAAVAVLRAAADRAREAGDAVAEIRARLAWSGCAYNTEDHATALALNEQSLRVAVDADAPPLIAAIRSRIAAIRGDTDHEQVLRTALEVCRRHGVRDIEASAYEELARLAFRAGRLAEAIDLADRVLPAAGPWAASGDRVRVEALCLTLAAEAPDDGFDARADAAVDRARHEGILHLEATALAALAGHRARTGRAGAARGPLLDLQERLMGGGFDIGEVGLALAETYLALGDPASALARAERAEAQARRTGREWVAALAEVAAARALVALDRGEEAVGRARSGMARVPRSAGVRPRALAWCGLVAVLRATGDPAVGDEAGGLDGWLARRGIGGWASIRAARG